MLKTALSSGSSKQGKARRAYAVSNCVTAKYLWLKNRQKKTGAVISDSSIESRRRDASLFHPVLDVRREVQAFQHRRRQRVTERHGDLVTAALGYGRVHDGQLVLEIFGDRRDTLSLVGVDSKDLKKSETRT